MHWMNFKTSIGIYNQENLCPTNSFMCNEAAILDSVLVVVMISKENRASIDITHQLGLEWHTYRHWNIYSSESNIEMCHSTLTELIFQGYSCETNPNHEI